MIDVHVVLGVLTTRELLGEVVVVVHGGGGGGDGRGGDGRGA